MHLVNLYLYWEVKLYDCLWIQSAKTNKATYPRYTWIPSRLDPDSSCGGQYPWSCISAFAKRCQANWLPAFSGLATFHVMRGEHRTSMTFAQLNRHRTRHSGWSWFDFGQHKRGVSRKDRLTVCCTRTSFKPAKMSLISALIAIGTTVLAEHSITSETFRTCERVALTGKPPDNRLSHDRLSRSCTSHDPQQDTA